MNIKYKEVRKMTIKEMIKKYRLTLVGEDSVQAGNSKEARKNLAELQAAKSEIIAELKAQKEAEENKLKEEIRKIESGEEKIVLHYYDGEYLQGYAVHGKAADLLEKLGLAKYVDGWGYRVSDETVNALGEEFTYPEAVEYVAPRKAAEAAEKTKKEAEKKAKFVEAKATGKPIELHRYVDDCNDPHEECSTDIITVWAMPDGTIKTTRRHTW